MPIELLSKEELITAAIATKRPVAFLIGAPLSLKGGVGVPGVTEVLDYVRDEIRDRAAFSLPRFEAALADKKGGEAYQEAMKWLGKNAGQDAINDVITKAVLHARKATALALPSGNGNPDDWSIPSGTTELGELVTRGNEKFLGPILTTNFDPLVSMAIRSAGGRCGRRVLSADGTLAGAAEDDICAIVHLHGFWRDSDTLHTQAQLTNPRPKLAKSLQRLLQRRTLIVAAYGGWDDVFTEALVDLMNDEQAPLDVIWCFYENDVTSVQERYGKLLTAVEPAIVMNRFRAFGGIDCHSIFGEILITLRGISPTATAPSIASPVGGWELIDAASLAGLAPLLPVEIIQYFDGATPTWRHAMCADIPSRADVGELTRRLATVLGAKERLSFQLIRAAGGEGKTTLLLQAAAVAAKSGDWNVLWRPTPRVGLPPEHVIALDPAKNWLVVADDAENLVRDIGESARLLQADGRLRIHFLLAARDTDWRDSSGDRRPWRTVLNQHPDILLRELSNDDANLLVEAWRKYGSEGLRELASRPKNKQVSALLGAVRDVGHARDEGSFFGGLLSVRFGPAGLRGHIVSLLIRLRGVGIENSDRSLFDALVYVAACHAVGLPGIDENVLADLVGVPREWVQTLVVNPLGAEAAAVRSAGHVLTRHSKVAAAILVASEQDIGVNVAEIWCAIVHQTVQTARSMKMDPRRFSNVVRVGSRLQRDLPHEFMEQRRKEIAIATATASVAAEPDRLSLIVDLGKTYRNAADLAAAVQVFRQNLKVLSLKTDFHTNVRGYYSEWAVSEDLTRGDASHRAAGAWIQGLSLADHLKPASVRLADAKLAFGCLGVAFGKLAEPQPDGPFARARRASAYLGRLSTLDQRALAYFNKHDREADKIGTPHPNNVSEAIAWLTTAVAQAGRELDDPFLKALIKPEQVSFRMLEQFVNAAMPNTVRAKIFTQPDVNKVSAAKTPPSHLQKTSTLRTDVREAVEKVAQKAWGAASDEVSPEERLRRAKREAVFLFPKLSPYVRREVTHHFTSEKWMPLIEREPKR